MTLFIGGPYDGFRMIVIDETKPFTLNANPKELKSGTDKKADIQYVTYNPAKLYDAVLDKMFTVYVFSQDLAIIKLLIDNYNPPPAEKWIDALESGEYDSVYKCPKCSLKYSVQAEDRVLSITCKCGFHGDI